MTEMTGAPRVHGIMTAYLQSQAVFNALDLGVFERLENNELTARALANQLLLDERPIRALLIALEGLKLVTSAASGYTNSPEASRFLVAQHPDYMGRFAEHQNVHYSNAVDLPSSIRSNTSVTKRVLHKGYSDQGAGAGEGDPGRRRLIDAMRVSSRLQSDQMAKKLTLREGATVVDLGCGSGDYSIAIARHHPTVSVTAVDYPAVAKIAAANISAAGLADRVTLAPGDIMIDPIPQCDAVLLSHVLDGYGSSQSELLLRKVFNEMRPNGQLFIHSHMPDVAEGTFPALFGLILLINTESGEVHQGQELVQLLQAVGFTDVSSSRVSFLSGLITATRAPS